MQYPRVIRVKSANPRVLFAARGAQIQAQSRHWREYERSCYSDPAVPTKGELTRQAILGRALGLATRVGLEALTIGRLADDLGMSKSGLFAHFRAKDTLQVQVLRYAAAQFVDAVIRPALIAPRGEARVRNLFDRWLLWARATPGRGGCLFVGSSTELDDKPGPARDELVRQQREWLAFISGAVTIGVEEGHFRKDSDPIQFAHDLYGIMLGYYHAARLLKDRNAELRARRAFDRLLGSIAQPLRAARRPRSA